MDILYVLGTGSKWDNNEIKYSLRSIEKYGKNVGRIFIATEKLPDFIDPEKVIHLPVKDVGKMPHINITNKIEYAIYNSDISNDFLLSSDDHFYIKETDFDNYPLYHKGEISIRLGGGEYWVSMKNTRSFLLKNDLSTLSTNPHCNTHFNKQLYIKNQDLINQSKKKRCGCEINCIIGNLMIKDGIIPVKYKDIKIKSFKNREDLIKKLGNTHCFSIYDDALKCGIKEYLNELFPDKSKYEK